MPAAKDFVSDAFAYDKFIGHVAAASPLLDAALQAKRDDGMPALDSSNTDAFLATCVALRFWERRAFERM